MSKEQAVVLSCGSDRLIGILHAGEQDAETGVVIVVGGPQYRAGSHRQFVLVARQIAAAGTPVLRFDHRGIGDSEGQPRLFTALDEDIDAAVAFLSSQISSLKNIVLMGLCDAASAVLMYAPADSRVAGLILLNPWARTSHGEAKSFLRHYYLQRLLQKSFWGKTFAGKFRLTSSLRDFYRKARAAGAREVEPDSKVGTAANFVPSMLKSIGTYQRPVLLMISGRDLTAKEFTDLAKDDLRWRKALNRPSVTILDLPNANHTMSTSEDLEAAGSMSVEWLCREIS